MNFLNNIEEVYMEINRCKSCSLYKNRLIPYGWRGNPKAKIMLIGEALGEKEQELGCPFVGRSGDLLDKLLEQIGLSVMDVFITNIVKDRPPENRDPFYDEVKACQNHLLNEIYIIRPKLIVTLGRVAGNWWNHYRPFEWMTYYPEKLWFPVYHPAYLLRNRTKINSWKSDLKNILNKLELIK